MKKEVLYNALKMGSQKIFKEKKFYLLVYGSYATNHKSELSDLDVMTITESCNDSEREKFNDFILSLHSKYNLKEDNEVPYKNKLIIDRKDVDSALKLLAFKNKYEYIIPEIRKDEEFLASNEVRWRLILNALTTPHDIVYSNSFEKYNADRLNAEKALYNLASELLLKMNKKKNVLNLLDSILYGPKGVTGELYLGYKTERPNVVEYLKKMFKRIEGEQ
jgi:predicted nucleotidyltransferase